MKSIIENAEKYVFELFKKELSNKFLYHNYLHTQRVVKSAKEIIKHTELTDKEKEIVLLSAWFHDVGYIKNNDNHEVESAKIAHQFLSEEKIPSETIETVVACIEATKFNKAPENLLEEIIKDADSSHLAKDYFFEVSELLRQEFTLLNKKIPTISIFNLNFISNIS